MFSSLPAYRPCFLSRHLSFAKNIPSRICSAPQLRCQPRPAVAAPCPRQIAFQEARSPRVQAAEPKNDRCRCWRDHPEGPRRIQDLQSLGEESTQLRQGRKSLLSSLKPGFDPTRFTVHAPWALNDRSHLEQLPLLRTTMSSTSPRRPSHLWGIGYHVDLREYSFFRVHIDHDADVFFLGIGRSILIDHWPSPMSRSCDARLHIITESLARSSRRNLSPKILLGRFQVPLRMPQSSQTSQRQRSHSFHR